jgi:Fic family protein
MSRKQAIEKSLLNSELSNPEILAYLSTKGIKSSKATLNRDLAELIEAGLVTSRGQGKNISYRLNPSRALVTNCDLDEYFQTQYHQRDINESFNDEIFDLLKQNQEHIFSKQEQELLVNLQNKFQSNYQRINPAAKNKETERLCIELAWKSSSIEGNTYSLLETETLIKTRVEATGHQRHEAIMILNHKYALDYIFANKDFYQQISPEKIINLHRILTEGLYVDQGIRRGLIGISGTKYRPPANYHNLEKYISDISNLINETENINLKAIFALLCIAYTQMFMDGNKRTSRMLANAILTAHKHCPLSLGSLDETEYKQALMVFYEKNNISNFKRLYLEQLDFAVGNYFLLE